VRISEGDAVMVRIHCRDAKGVVVRLLAEVEGLHLRITHTNVVQFSASVLIVNVMAKASSSTFSSRIWFGDDEFGLLVIKKKKKHYLLVRCIDIFEVLITIYC
jgi:hypothetical protein